MSDYNENNSTLQVALKAPFIEVYEKLKWAILETKLYEGKNFPSNNNQPQVVRVKASEHHGSIDKGLSSFSFSFWVLGNEICNTSTDLFIKQRSYGTLLVFNYESESSKDFYDFLLENAKGYKSYPCASSLVEAFRRVATFIHNVLRESFSVFALPEQLHIYIKKY